MVRPKRAQKATGNKTPANKNQPASTSNNDPSGLFNSIKEGKNLDRLVDDWINFYESEPDHAILKIIQLIITSCGFSGQLDANKVFSKNYDVILDKIIDQVEEDFGSDYPLIRLGAPWKKFRSNFADFMMLLAIKCKSGIIYDQSLMDHICSLLTIMSDSKVRPFRHTATFAGIFLNFNLNLALKLFSAIVDIVVELVELGEKNAIQIETEKNKLKQMGTNERLDILLSSKTELDSKIYELCEILKFMFTSVFVRRYRDVVPDIRSICINELGKWMLVYPDYFLEDSYLKYIGWCLFDKDSDVRLKCITSLMELYERDDLVDKFELFTNKFKERLVSMVMDIEMEVAIRTCRLMIYIQKAFPTVLEKKDCEMICELVYCNNRALATAAGEFLNAKVFLPNIENYQKEGSNSSDLWRIQSLKDLATFYIEGELHTHSAYLVDSLIDTVPMLKDWQAMVDLLLMDESEFFDTQLIDIMCCSIKQLATGEAPTGRISTTGRRAIAGAGNAAKDARILTEERIRISEVLIPALPKLMARHLDELMNNLLRIVEQHTDDEILRNVAQVVEFFTTNIAVAQQTEAARLHLIDGVALQLRQGMNRFVTEDHLDEEDEAALLSSYRKMTAFSLFIDIRRWDYWDMTLNMLNNSNRFQSASLAEKGILLLAQSIMWELRHVIQDSDFSEETIQRLRRRRDQFLYSAKIMLRDGAFGVECAFLSLCDILILFNWKLAADFENIELAKTLPIKLEGEITHRICSFVVDNVFVLEENESFKNLNQHTQIQLLNKRRNILGQYCKLIIHGVLPVIDASAVLAYYTKFYNDFGDLLKALLQKCREMDKVLAAKAIVKALITVYDDLKAISDDNNVDPNSEQFCALKELAKRFALSFGPDLIKNREAIAMIHKDGIMHAFNLEEYRQKKRLRLELKNIAFLEVLIEFSSKLMRQDKTALLNYLIKHCPEIPEPIVDDDSHWQSFLLYKNSLSKIAV